jgi:hypothetical protein
VSKIDDTILALAAGIALLPEGRAAAARALDILTSWLRAHPKCAYVTRIDSTGRFEFTVAFGAKTAAFFKGSSLQDAYAQAAQALSLDGDFALDGDTHNTTAQIEHHIELAEKAREEGRLSGADSAGEHIRAALTLWKDRR